VDVTCCLLVASEINKLKESADAILPQTVDDTSLSATANESLHNPAGVPTSASEVTVRSDLPTLPPAN